MNTNIMIGLAILTGTVAVGALVLNRWLEQRRLERMRAALLHTDEMSRASSFGEALMPWLSADAQRFLGEFIQFHAQKLALLKVPGTPRSERASALAEEWLVTPPPSTNKPVPQQLKDAKSLRSILMDYIELIKSAHQQQLIATPAAKDRIKEAKLLNARICVSAYRARAKAALAQNSPNQALHFLKRAETAMRSVVDLPDDMKSDLEIMQKDISELEEQRYQSNTTSRLADATDQLTEEDDAWKKKHYD